MNDSPVSAGGTTTPARFAAALLSALLLWAALSLQLGCPQTPSSPSSNLNGPGDPEGEILKQREVFNQAIHSILEYQQYDDAEVLQQAIGRLDQWVQHQKPLADWQVDPMVSTLPQPFSPLIEGLQLDRLEFPNPDLYSFLEAAWLRDVSSWARGDAVDELDQARHLFDWTVRNVQLDWGPAADASGTSGRVVQKPWETLLLGRGTATDRAWVFILLARQQGIDAALLALIDPEDASGQRTQPWVVAVLSQGQLYLFEPTLGLPLPAPHGVKREASGPLDIRPATLAQVADDDALLRQFDLGEFRYPVEASQVQQVVALLEASPAYLSQRMRLVENRLSGDERLVLTAEPSAQAERLKACQHVGDARLWATPFQTLVQEVQLGPNRNQWWLVQMIPFMAPTGPHPGLWKGRQYHLKGIFTGEQSAATYYQMARPPDRAIREAEQLDPRMKAALLRAKMDASYWLGLIAAEQGNHEAAVDWLGNRTLEATPQGPWTGGAKYNLARVYEADGQTAKAAQTYRSDRQSPALHGNLIRAGWLQPQPTPKSPAPPTADDAEQEAAPKTKEATPEAEQEAAPKTKEAAPEVEQFPPEMEQPPEPPKTSPEEPSAPSRAGRGGPATGS